MIYPYPDKAGDICGACRGPVIGQPDFTGAGWVEVPLKQVVERRTMHEVWRLNDVPYGSIEMELQWLPILEES